MERAEKEGENHRKENCPDVESEMICGEGVDAEEFSERSEEHPIGEVVDPGIGVEGKHLAAAGNHVFAAQTRVNVQCVNIGIIRYRRDIPFLPKRMNKEEFPKYEKKKRDDDPLIPREDFP